MIYLDNAASSWPKPNAVITAMTTCLTEFGANPGRGSHQLALRASRTLLRVRTKLAQLFNAPSTDHMILQQNATEALNLAIKGFLSEGDHVVTSMLEHNSVRRPLEYLRRVRNVNIDYAEVDASGILSVEAMERCLRPDTRMIVLTHASNVLGSLAPIRRIGHLAHERGIVFLVDASQTAGAFPIDVQDMKIDMLAFTGHKSLYGPQGTGGLYIQPGIQLEPLLHGGTGGYSELVDQPPDAPDRYESGTHNTVGFAGLEASLDYLQSIGGVTEVRRHERLLTDHALSRLGGIKGVTILGPSPEVERAPIVSFLVEGYDASEIGFILDQHYQIAVRTGLHCSPLAHEAIGTLSQGAIRASFGYMNTTGDVDALADAVGEIVMG